MKDGKSQKVGEKRYVCYRSNGSSVRLTSSLLNQEARMLLSSSQYFEGFSSFFGDYLLGTYLETKRASKS